MIFQIRSSNTLLSLLFSTGPQLLTLVSYIRHFVIFSMKKQTENIFRDLTFNHESENLRKNNESFFQ